MMAYCKDCGAIRPAGRDDPVCIPCGNSGHWSRLVTSHDDRIKRIANFQAFYDKHGFTVEQIANIPHFQRLLHPPAGV